MQSRIVGQLRMEGHSYHFSLPNGHRVTIDLSQYFDIRASFLYPWRANKDTPQGAAVDPVEVEIGLEAAYLTPERVTPRCQVEDIEVLAVEHDHARAGRQYRRTVGDQVAQRLRKLLALDAERHRRALPPG